MSVIRNGSGHSWSSISFYWTILRRKKLCPVLIFICIYLVYPIVATFINSTMQWNGISAEKKFIGLYNWNKLIHDADFWRAFLNNVKVMILSLVIQMPIGILLATFLDSTGKKFNIFKTIWFLPLLMSSVAVPMTREQ